MNREPRYSATEEQRDVREALEQKLEARPVVIERYTAVGSTSAKIPLAARRFPVAVVLIDARAFFDQGAPLTLTPNYSFVWDSVSKTAQVYEPSGLVANTVYRLAYLVIGG
ncbi:MAG TPA: hypothetical protein VED01_03230 [Burkholderiales bacterium]|nr:hypothetical protein [Burkholderiales bacterium]